MKTKLLYGALLLSCTIAGIASYLRTEGNEIPLVLASVEVMANNESVTPSNTGPAEEKKCMGGGHRMVCRCINSHPCTGTDCY